MGRALYEGRLTLPEALEAAAHALPDDARASSSSRSRPPWPRFTYLGLERAGRGAGCRWPAARSPGPRSDSCWSTSAAQSRRPPAAPGAARCLAQHVAPRRPLGRGAGLRGSLGRGPPVRRRAPGADTLPDSRPFAARARAARGLGVRSAVIVVSRRGDRGARDIPPDLLLGAGVRLFPREPQPDLAITRVTGPARVSAGDSIPLEVDGAGRRGRHRRQLFGRGRSPATKRLACERARLRRAARAAGSRIVVSVRGRSPGDHCCG